MMLLRWISAFLEKWWTVDPACTCMPLASLNNQLGLTIQEEDWSLCATVKGDHTSHNSWQRTARIVQHDTPHFFVQNEIPQYRSFSTFNQPRNNLRYSYKTIAFLSSHASWSNEQKSSYHYLTSFPPLIEIITLPLISSPLVNLILQIHTYQQQP